AGAADVALAEGGEDLVALPRRALGEVLALIGDGAPDLDLQRQPAERLDQRRVTRQLGDGFMEGPIAGAVGFHVAAMQGLHPLVEQLLEPGYMPIAHLRYGEFHCEALEHLAQLIEILGFLAREAAYEEAAIGADLDQPLLGQRPERLAEGSPAHL